MIYPKKLNSKKTSITVYLCTIISLMVAILLVIINKLTTPQIPWAAISNCGIIYTWLTVIYSIKRNTNIAGHVLLQTIAISAVMLYIDKTTGLIGWSISLGIPIILITANLTTLILTIISYKKYVEYAIYQLAIVIISIISCVIGQTKIIQLGLFGKFAITISIVNLIITLGLCYKDVKEAIVMKLHM